MVAQLKLEIPKEWRDWIEKEERKENLKKIGAAIGIGIGGFICYKVGSRVTFVRCVNNLTSFFNMNPDLKAAYIKAVKDTYVNKKK